jgi:predicted HTH transcriptional regulator
MNKIADEQMAALLEAGYELRSREYKSPFSWTDVKSRWLKEKVTQAILGMTNTKSGGRIVIGIEEGDKGEIKLKGLIDEQVKSFEDYDSIKGYVDGFSHTETNFDISWGELDDKKYVIITVQEFDEIPAICKKDGQEKDIIKRAVIYCRSKKAPYSTIPATDIELREIIHMSVDKEKGELKSRGWVKEGEISPEEFYKDKIKDIL